MEAIAIVKLCLLPVVLIFSEQASADRCPHSQTTTLATFNAAFVPFYPGNAGQPEFEERTALLIQQVSGVGRGELEGLSMYLIPCFAPVDPNSIVFHLISPPPI